MSGHTPGELQLWTSNSFRRFGTNGRGGGLVCEPITQSDGHPDLHFRNGGPTGPDARRMLATWNACRGINTEYLETTTSLREAEIARKTALERGRDDLIEVARAAIAYDDAIQACANDPDKMASYCTAEGDTLDELYLDWVTKARAAVAKYPEAKS